MVPESFPFRGGCALRFVTDLGTVWAIVRGTDVPGRMDLSVYEEDTALAAAADPGEILTRGSSVTEDCAKNRFGTGLMLSICRAIRGAFPGVEFAYERTGGARPLRERVRA